VWEMQIKTTRLLCVASRIHGDPLPVLVGT
jgi:hypothetical protein